MGDPELEQRLAALPPLMRFAVRHAVALSVAAIVVFASLLVYALVGLHHNRAIVATFCVLALAGAVLNLTMARVIRRRLGDPGA